MKLLIMTQRVNENDQLLGFFIEWIKKFAEIFDKVLVICLEAGEYHLPDKIKVLSLGKERKASKVQYLFNFYRYILRYHDDYDVVFVHMNPLYVVLGGIVWKLLGKKVSLWYAHGHVSNMLRLADWFTDIAFTSTPEGYRLKSRKKIVVGQGIVVEKFKPSGERKETEFKIISVGRISPSKDYGTLIDALAELKREGVKVPSVDLIGIPATGPDSDYLKELREKARAAGLEDKINYLGLVLNKNLPAVLSQADLFVNMSHTGSLDKTILEAMACGLVVITCNEALTDILGPYTVQLMFEKKDYLGLARKIRDIMNMDREERIKIAKDLREIVVTKHNLPGLINLISTILVK